MRIERDQTWTIFALGIMLLGTVLGLWLPMRMHQSHLREAIAAAKGVTSEGDTHHLQALANEVADMHKTLEVRRRIVPQEADLADLLKALSADLASLRVTDQETQSQATVLGDDFGVIPVTLHFRGTFPTVFQFLNKVESMQRLVRVTRLDVTGVAEAAAVSDPDKNNQALNVNVELCTFYTPLEASKP